MNAILAEKEATQQIINLRGLKMCRSLGLAEGEDERDELQRSHLDLPDSDDSLWKPLIKDEPVDDDDDDDDDDLFVPAGASYFCFFLHQSTGHDGFDESETLSDYMVEDYLRPPHRCT